MSGIVRPGLEQIDPGNVANGTYSVNVVSGTIIGLTVIPPIGVMSVVQGTNMIVDITDPHNPIVSLASELYVLTSTLGADPVLVWDGDDQLVYTEVTLP